MGIDKDNDKISFRTDEDVKNVLKLVAKQNCRDLTKEINYRLLRTLKEDGLLETMSSK